MIIDFHRSQDYALIRRILTHPKVYPHISDDGSPPVDQYQPVISEAVWYVIAQDVYPEAADLLGLWMFVPQNAICWEVHTALLPVAWGGVGLAAARVLPWWIWDNTPCRRIVTNVPSTNRLALQFALRAGMHVYGVNEASYLKDGNLCDQVCLGLSKPQKLPRAGAEPALESIGLVGAGSGRGAGGLDVSAHAPASPGERSAGAEMRATELI